MLALTFGAVGLALWSIDRSAQLDQRVELAHKSYQEHLALRANATDLFKQYSDALLTGDRDLGAGEAELKEAIWANIGAIRKIIGNEIALVGEEEIMELDELSRLEDKLRRLIRDMELFTARTRERGDFDAEELAPILDDRVDVQLRALVDTAMTNEIEELQEARVEAARQSVLARGLALGLLTAAVLSTIAIIALWRTRLSEPLSRLLEGVRALSRGDYSTRMRIGGTNEIAAIARVFDDLAARVATREQLLAEQNAALEAAVAERTEDLARALNEAKAAEEARRMLLADVSHELRTPLTIILGESDVALRGGDKAPEDYREALVRTREAAVHTTALVEDLLFIARTEAGRPRLTLDQFDLGALLQQAVNMEDSQVPVINPLRHAPIRADRNRIRQAILALVHNALRHGGEDIEVSLGRTECGYRIKVADRGPGLAQEDLDLAFTRFWRGPKAPQQHRAGSGLGLPIVRSIASAHGGVVWLEQRPQGGIVAILDLPQQTPEDEKAA